MKVVNIIKWLLLMLVCVSAEVIADADGEREALSILVQEIDALEHVIKIAQAQAASSNDALKYDWLKQDIEIVRQGIVDYITVSQNKINITTTDSIEQKRLTGSYTKGE